LLRGDTVDLYSYQGERITVYDAYASPSTSSVSEDVGAGSKTIAEPRHVHITRVGALYRRLTFCDEYLSGGESNRDYGPDVPERLTEPPVYCTVIGCKSDAPSWLRSS